MLRRRLLLIIAGYVLTAAAWIVVSDGVLFVLLKDIEQPYRVSVLKGVGFIAFTSAVLYVLLRSLARAEQRAEKLDSMLTELTPQLFSSVPVVMYAVEVPVEVPVDAPIALEPLWVSHNIGEILGYTPEQALAPSWWSTHLHPDDRAATLRHAMAIRDGQSNTARHEYRLRHADGHYLHVLDELRRVPDAHGRLRRYIGAWTDITEQRAAEQTLRRYSQQIEDAMLGTVTAMATMVEQRDPYTAGHQRRVGELSAAIAREMGLDVSRQKGLTIAGVLHDVGKIRVPSELLTKPTRLTAAEYALIQEHAQAGYEILKNIDFPWPIAEIARQHHERIDGSGYPRGLVGDQILLEARILAVADVIESMGSPRPYRSSLGLPAALDEIERNAGRLYDADVAAASLRLMRDKAYPLPV